MAFVSGLPSKEEVLVPLRVAPDGSVPQATHVRSTLIGASLLAIRTHGYFDAYLKNLAPSFHDTVLHSVAGTWLPLDVANAHYQAADALGLSTEEQMKLGGNVAERIQNSMLGTLVRVAKGVGVTPWTGLEYFQRLWDRVLMGGAGAVYRIGPKEARVEGHGVPTLAEVAYFRNGFRGMFTNSGALFCNKLYVHDLPRFVAAKKIGFRLAWA